MRMPPSMRMAMNMKRRTGTKLAPAGALALVAGGVGGVAYFKQTAGFDTYAKVTIIVALIAAVVGGALSLVKQEIGAPIAAAGLTPFMAIAAGYLGSYVSFDGALDPLEAKLFVVAGVVGLIAAVIALVGLAGEGNPPLGAVIALLAVVPPVCFAAVVHIDDFHPAAVIGAVIGQVVIAVVIASGGLRGRLGGLISIVAAGLLLPRWIQLVKDNDDRRAASLAALLAVIVIIVLGLTLVALAMRTASADDDPALITDNWQTSQGAAVVPVAAVVRPNYTPPPAVAQPQTGPVVRPVGPPATPVPQPTNGQWATDPYGRYQVRYWNGKRWTDHVASNGITGLDPVETV